MTADDPVAALREEVAGAIRGYLRSYTLAANVALYVSPDDNHDTVVERCAPLLADALLAHLAPLVEARERDARREGGRRVAMTLALHYEQANGKCAKCRTKRWPCKTYDEAINPLTYAANALTPTEERP